MDGETERKFLDFLNWNKNVIRVNNVFGSWDYFTDLEINSEEFRRFMDEFTKTFSNQIQEYETLIIYNEIKFTFSPVF